MSIEHEQEHRRARLARAAERLGGNVALGRLLGYKDGAFVRQMLAGERQITEKTVAKLEAKHGWAGWFSIPEEGAHPLRPPKDFRDSRRVSDADWEILQAAKLVLTEQELANIKAQAERIRRIALEQVEVVAAKSAGRGRSPTMSVPVGAGDERQRDLEGMGRAQEDNERG